MTFLESHEIQLITINGISSVLALLIPLGAVFLGLLFAMRYHAFYEKFDELLIESGVQGFTDRQKEHLRRVRSAIFGAVAIFIASLVIWMLFGIPFVEETRWAFLTVCGGLFILTATLLVTSILDIRNGIARPWIRYLVMCNAISGVIAAPLAAFTMTSAFGF